MALANTHISFNLTETERNELQHQSIKIISVLIKHDDQWLSTQQELVEALKQIWCNDEFQVISNLRNNHLIIALIFKLLIGKA